MDETILRDISKNVNNGIMDSCSETVVLEDQVKIYQSVCYIHDDNLMITCDKLPKIHNRASVVHSLIQAYGLLQNMNCVSPQPAQDEDLLLFHTQDYIDCLKRLSNRDDDEKYEEGDELFGLTYDCPAFPGAHEYGRYVTGASIKGAQMLMSGTADVAIHWTGGWHHASRFTPYRDEASGFCYYNDIVIAILMLRQKFDRVLYIDIDLHHGDGVESAFCVTPKVMTVSFHKYSPGFFPGTGKLEDIGIGKGRYFAVNVPLKDGIQDSQYVDVFKRIMDVVQKHFQPLAIVCQCGADGLVNDPMDSFNLTPQSYVDCVEYIMGWKLPILLLGGGGYHTANTARCWALITAAVLGQTISDDVPEHKYFPLYGPDYEVNLTTGNRPNLNTKDYLESVVSSVSGGPSRREFFPKKIKSIKLTFLELQDRQTNGTDYNAKTQSMGIGVTKGFLPMGKSTASPGQLASCGMLGGPQEY